MTKPNPKMARYAEAYLTIANAKITFGPLMSEAEAARYAAEFYREDEATTFNLGCTDFQTSRAAVFAVEAIRLLNAGTDGVLGAVALLQLAIDDITHQAAEQPA